MHPRWLRDSIIAMTTPTKSSTTASAKHASVRMEVLASPPKPFLRFQHSQKLRDKTLNVLGMVEGAKEATAHAAQLTELVLELTDSGMDQYFLQSLKAAKVNFVVQQSAALGLVGVQKVMGTVIRGIIGRMDNRQLVSVCSSIRQFMV